MLEPADRDRLWLMIKGNEGVRSHPYRDTAGILTIGVGRNLEAVGLSAPEIDLLLANDVQRATQFLNSFTWFSALNAPRQAALIDMVFNLGAEGFKHFDATITAIMESNWAWAAVEMLDSLWAKQVGRRAIRDAAMIGTGEWQA